MWCVIWFIIKWNFEKSENSQYFLRTCEFESVGSESASSFVVAANSRDFEENRQTTLGINPTTQRPDTTLSRKSVMSGFCKFTGNFQI